MEDPTNSEIGRSLNELKDNVRDGFEKMNLRLDRYVLGEVHSLYVQHTERRIGDVVERLEAIEDNHTAGVRWALTTAVAVLALLASITLGIIAIL